LPQDLIEYLGDTLESPFAESLDPEKFLNLSCTHYPHCFERHTLDPTQQSSRLGLPFEILKFTKYEKISITKWLWSKFGKSE